MDESRNKGMNGCLQSHGARREQTAVVSPGVIFYGSVL